MLHAHAVYKCQSNGVTSYGEQPCGRKIEQTCKGGDGRWSASACKEIAESKPSKPNPFAWRPAIGMSRDEVEAALSAMSDAKMEDYPHAPNAWWGTPHINSTTTSHGVREQWVFDQPNPPRYLYFENGVVVAIQE